MRNAWFVNFGFVTARFSNRREAIQLSISDNKISQQNIYICRSLNYNMVKQFNYSTGKLIQ